MNYSKQHREGFIAAIDGLHWWKDKPYHLATLEGLAWLKGWMEGDEYIKRIKA